jgi:hypothetical protein
MLNGNGKTHHQYSDAVVDKLCAAGLLNDADRDDQKAVDAAIVAVLNKFTAVPPNHPVNTCYVTPQIECGANTHLMLGLLPLLVLLGVLPAEAVAALFAQAKASADAGHLPAGLLQLLDHKAAVVDWSLRPHGASIGSKEIARRGLR